MVETFGLSHLALSVQSPERSFRFYEALLGARLLGSHSGRETTDLSGEDVLEWGTPGAHDVITLTRAAKPPSGGISHFGFRLITRDEPDDLAHAVEQAGGTVIEKGRFESSGEPVVYAHDPDGYEVELWFESDPPWRVPST